MLRPVALGLYLAAVSLMGWSTAWACAEIPVTARIVEAPRFRLVVLPDPAPIPLHVPFALEIRLCDARMAELPRLMHVDAQMPAHRHGMNYSPTIIKQDWGVYRAEGLLLHMPGEWEFSFEFSGADRSERLTFRYTAQ